MAVSPVAVSPVAESLVLASPGLGWAWVSAAPSAPVSAGASLPESTMGWTRRGTDARVDGAREATAPPGSPTTIPGSGDRNDSADGMTHRRHANCDGGRDERPEYHHDRPRCEPPMTAAAVRWGHWCDAGPFGGLRDRRWGSLLRRGPRCLSAPLPIVSPYCLARSAPAPPHALPNASPVPPRATMAA